MNIFNVKVSIIVPCWGVEKYLDRCVESLVNQTLHDIEIILVDDESPDRVPEMCDEWAARDSRIKVVHKKNGGLGMACNSGIEVATGQYVAFCDSDDWVDAEMYETMYKAAKEHRAQMVFTGIRRVNENNVFTPMAQAEGLHIYNTRQLIDSFMMDMIASAPSKRRERRVQASAKIVLYSRSSISENNIRFESERQYLSEDMLFNLDNMSKASRVIELPQTFYNYLVNTQSISQKIRTDRFDKYVFLRDAMKQRYKDVLPNEYTTRVDRMFMGYTRSALEQLLKGSEITEKDRNTYLNHIASHQCWNELSSTYPLEQMPLLHRIVFFALRYRQLWLLKLIYKIK